MGLFAKGITLRAKAAANTPARLETPLPAQVILPLKQTIGEPAEPVVEPGEEVVAGQLIARAPHHSGVPLHAPISGSVKGIDEVVTAQGATGAAIVIESDGKVRWGELPEPDSDRGALEMSELVTRIREAGLITPGLMPRSVAAELVASEQPTTHLALTHRRVVKAIDTLIISALDSEPMLMVNRVLAGETHESLPAGVAALRALSGAAKVIFVVDGAAPQIRELAASDEQETTTVISRSAQRYPVGLPVPLIKAVTGREVPLPYGHPRDVGIALFDLATTIAIGTAVTERRPQTEIMITVGGGALTSTGLITVKIGTPIGAVIEAAGGYVTEAAKLIVGGPLTGVAHYDTDVPLTKEVTGLFALTSNEITLTAGYRECINCGRCVAVCPVNLVPGMLSMYCAKERFDTAAHQGLLSCIECGCCDYVCPSRRPLVHLFRHGKHQLMEGER